jgi:hypothetical protein
MLAFLIIGSLLPNAVFRVIYTRLVILIHAIKSGGLIAIGSQTSYTQFLRTSL